VDRATLERLAGERGSAVVAESLSAGETAVTDADRRFEDAVRSRGGGLLGDALRRDDRGAVRRLLARGAWLPDLDSCLELQATMPVGWTLVPRDGGAAIGELVVTLGPDGGVIERQASAQRLAAEIYLDSGTRSMERGIVSAGRDPETGQHRHPRLELVRLTIPRRVYTTRQLRAVAGSVAGVYDRRDETVGLDMIEEPKYLRFFQARFRPLEDR
jgi:tyrosine phenol-lyase